MTKKQFTEEAIKNGFDDTGCNGWNWIRENIKELDYVFQTEEYKNCKCFVSQCLPVLLGDDDLSELEKAVLHTAWYCNNERVYEQKKKDKIDKFNKDGFFNIENNEKFNGKKIEFIRDTSADFFGGLQKYTGKLVWSKMDKSLMCVPGKKRTRGWWLNKDIYIKWL
jgi:hypothetical protein